MNSCTLVSILLVIFVLGGESLANGGEHRFRGGEEHLRMLHEVEKRTVNKKGDHLFNNIAKGFTKMIQDVFLETKIHGFCSARAAGDQFIIEDTTDKNKDVTDEFPGIEAAFREYKGDKLLTEERDKLSVYGREHEGADDNALQWSANIEEIRRRVFALIDKFIELQIKREKQPMELLAMLNSLRDKIDQIINRQEYVDQDAMRIFKQDTKNNDKFNLVGQVEQRSQAALRELPGKANQWAVEAANFVKMKVGGKK